MHALRIGYGRARGIRRSHLRQADFAGLECGAGVSEIMLAKIDNIAFYEKYYLDMFGKPMPTM
ncbi:hypothetical protein [Candidimonas humi]|uniref:hypothetical protein n=1 Tax=Candidimonas humi TaxID=683355 RepID=UPI00366DEB9B